MSDVIERLLEVEKEARQVIAQAEQEAADTTARAREQARRIVAESREEARRQAEDLHNREVRALQEQKQERIRQERAKLPSADSIDPEKLDESVAFVVRTIAYGDETDR